VPEMKVVDLEKHKKMVFKSFSFEAKMKEKNGVYRNEH
jgi:hypothetical protein